LLADIEASAQMRGRERYENFVETLGRRLPKGQTLLREIAKDVWRSANASAERTDIAFDANTGFAQATRPD
jgi:hypothetical protein